MIETTRITNGTTTAPLARTIEVITRDSKGKPDEAANNTRQLINGDGCEIIIDAEASSGAFAVQGGLLAAKAQFDKGQTDAAKGTDAEALANV